MQSEVQHDIYTGHAAKLYLSFFGVCELFKNRLSAVIRWKMLV